MRILTCLLVIFFTSLHLYSQPCDTNALTIHKVSASTIDPSITPFELNRHHAFYNPDCTAKNVLVFYLVGTFGNPKLNLFFTKMAANNGFHVISVKYPNNTSATSACAGDNDTTCYENFHKEAIFGTDLCAAISIDSTNCIYTRGLKLLQYLETNYPSENWGQFLTGGNDIDWTKVITAGHSQGSGHASYLAHIFPVQRGLMFSGPNEYMNNYNRIASWVTSNSVTADSNLYSFSSIHDELSAFEKQYAIWDGLGMSNHGDTVDVIQNNCPYNDTRMLYTTDSVTDGGWSNHGAPVSDDYTPVDGNGTPIYTDVWKYMLGICNTPTGIANTDFNNKLSIYPIPADNSLVIQPNQQLSNVQLTITNTLGKIVWESHQPSLSKQEINIKGLSSGIYIINIDSEEIKETRKIIIK